MSKSKQTIIKRRKHYKEQRKKELTKYKKEERLSIRVSAIEKNAILKFAKDLDPALSLSDYVIASSLNVELLKIDYSSLDEFSKLLSNFGSLLNQITRTLNEARFNDSVDNNIIEQTQNTLEELYKEYEDDLQVLRKYHLEASRIRRETMINIFEPEDYDLEDS